MAEEPGMATRRGRRAGTTAGDTSRRLGGERFGRWATGAGTRAVSYRHGQGKGGTALVTVHQRENWHCLPVRQPRDLEPRSDGEADRVHGQREGCRADDEARHGAGRCDGRWRRRQQRNVVGRRGTSGNRRDGSHKLRPKAARCRARRKCKQAANGIPGLGSVREHDRGKVSEFSAERLKDTSVARRAVSGGMATRQVAQDATKCVQHQADRPRGGSDSSCPHRTAEDGGEQGDDGTRGGHAVRVERVGGQ
mmetsp:Transcript_5936/g.19376  ORF Transcript_5936/g.19376 Transcript_5936/m.19376 type:complete len:251 (+) Transcript_5936:2787-3539(+)